MTRGPHVLAAHADVLRTKVGAAFPGSRAVFRGHDLHKGEILLERSGADGTTFLVRLPRWKSS